MKKFNTLKFALMAFVLTLCVSAAHAQPGYDDETVNDAPLDGGISLLVISSIAFGVKSMHKFKKQGDTII